MIQRHRLDERGYRGERFRDHGARPEGQQRHADAHPAGVVGGIHRAYLEAGADIIETNTFNSNSVSQADYGAGGAGAGAQLSRRRPGARACRRVCARRSDGRRFVAGALGPTSRMASLSPDVNDPGFRNVTFDELVATYLRAGRARCSRAACDLLLIETVFDTLNAKAAIFAVRQLFDERGVEVPIIVSGTITDASGRDAVGSDGGGVLEFDPPCASRWRSDSTARWAAEQLRPYIEELARIARHLRVRLSERGTAERIRRVSTRRRTRRPRCCRNSRRAAW